MIIDRTDEFDSLDEAARHLQVTNMSEIDFWVLETDEDLLSLRDLISEGRRESLLSTR